MDIKRAWKRFKQFGGLTLVKVYWKMGVMGTVMREGVSLLFGRRRADEAYSAIIEKVSPVLCEQYEALLYSLKEKYDELEQSGELAHGQSGKIWFCWLQGMEQAPELVRMCLWSLRQFTPPDKEVVVLSYANYQEYVTLPDYIVEKYESGRIPAASFSDLLRLELLIQHGGTWIDSTVVCLHGRYPRKVLDCDLFLFQTLHRDDRRFYGISNWFITACRNNKLLLVLRDVLHQYWKDYDCLVQYYIFHLFFAQIVRLYPEEIEQMPRANRLGALQLGGRLMDDYHAALMRRIEDSCCFQKLNYRKEAVAKGNPRSFYYELVRRFGSANGA